MHLQVAPLPWCMCGWQPATWYSCWASCWLDAPLHSAVCKLPHQLSEAIFELLATGGMPFTTGATKRGFNHLNEPHLLVSWRWGWCNA